MTFEFDHARQQCPDLAIAQSHKTATARHGRLEGDPGGGYTVVFRGRFPDGDLPVRRLGCRQLLVQHVGDRVLALHRLDVPSEGDEIAPVAVVLEHGHGARDVARFEGIGSQSVEESVDGFGRGSIEHGSSSCNAAPTRQRLWRVKDNFPVRKMDHVCRPLESQLKANLVWIGRLQYRRCDCALKQGSHV